MNIHKTDKYLLNPVHPVSVILVGAGGTGSHMINILAKINAALRQLDHMGLFVMLFDDDTIEAHNIGRQNFSIAQIGENKAQELILTLNRFYGTNWTFYPEKYDGQTANIIITCTDTIKSRKQVRKAFEDWNEDDARNAYNYNNHYRGFNSDMARPYYWFDIGNDADFGQCILQSKCGQLPGVFHHHKELETKKDKKNKVTCSMAESLQKQDLLINSIMANYTGHMLWTMFSKLKIDYNGVYVNLNKLSTAKIPIL